MLYECFLVDSNLESFLKSESHILISTCSVVGHHEVVLSEYELRNNWLHRAKLVIKRKTLDISY